MDTLLDFSEYRSKLVTKKSQIQDALDACMLERAEYNPEDIRLQQCDNDCSNFNKFITNIQNSIDIIDSYDSLDDKTVFIKAYDLVSDTFVIRSFNTIILYLHNELKSQMEEVINDQDAKSQILQILISNRSKAFRQTVN